MTEPTALGTETLPPHLRVVYVLSNRSLTDLVMLDIVAEANDLPRPRAPLTDQGIPERHRFFFLNRPSGFLLRRNLMRTYSKRMLRLQRYFRDTRKADISLVPVSVFWSRAPNKERSVIRVLLSEDWTVTSRFRRFVDDSVQSPRHHRSVRRADRAARSRRAADQRRPVGAPHRAARARAVQETAHRPARPGSVASSHADQPARPQPQRPRSDRCRSGERQVVGSAFDVSRAPLRARDGLRHVVHHDSTAAARVDVVLEPDLRRHRRARHRTDKAVGRNVDARLRAVPSQPRRLPRAVVSAVQPGSDDSARRGRR